MLNLSRQRIDKIIAQEKLYSLRAIKTPKAGKILARWMLGISLIFLIILFVP